MRRRGFTLLELTFVISIIAILASILFPVFARARETARKAKCANNLQQIGMALGMYAHDYDGHFPKKNNEFRPIYRYAQNMDVFCCPSDSEVPSWDVSAVSPPEEQIPKKIYSSYVYRGGLSNDDRADMIIAGEYKLLHGEMVNVLYLGCYVKGVPIDGYKPVVAPPPMPKAPPAPGPGTPAAAPGQAPPQ